MTDEEEKAHLDKLGPLISQTILAYWRENGCDILARPTILALSSNVTAAILSPPTAAERIDALSVWTEATNSVSVMVTRQILKPRQTLQ